MAKTDIFHVQESVLSANGFVKHCWFDKDSPKDTFNTLRFEDHTKKINDYLSIVVSYNYTTKDEKEYILHSSAIEIMVEEYSTCLPIHNLSDLLTLLRILSGDE